MMNSRRLMWMFARKEQNKIILIDDEFVFIEKIILSEIEGILAHKSKYQYVDMYVATDWNTNYLLLVDIIPPIPGKGIVFWEKKFRKYYPPPPYRLTKKYI